MNRWLATALSFSLGLAAFVVACSSDDGSPSSEASSTNPGDDAGDETHEDAASPEAKDAGTDAKDASTKDSSGDSEPDAATLALTKAQIQTLFDGKCAPCHVGGSSGGMSLASDFTKATVDVASSALPSMKRITKGDREKSYLFHKLAGTHKGVGGSGARMPASGPPYLSDDQIEGIGAFIDGL